jgi:hypothetical protein
MIYFTTRTLARKFAAKSNHQVVDLGVQSEVNRRWAVKVVIK